MQSEQDVENYLTSSRNHFDCNEYARTGAEQSPGHRGSVTRRELLAMVTMMHQFWHYLLGKIFLLRTDHRSFGFKDQQGRFARWLKTLLYDFEK